MANALKKSRAKKAYVCNIMTKYGETQGFGVLDFVREIEAYTHEGVLDYVIVNTKRPSAGRVKTYEKEKAEFVEYRPQELRGKTFRVVAKPLLRSRGYIRHDSDALARTIISLL
ncbi:MAG: YvcK family protein [Candidatus Wildermuthbacteria bacterium]|nr:YvcK family protein [Candidatus Wildermuthbacteria bacterium]